jgi:dihydroxyacetone kinase-like predicted kinase
MNDIIKEVKSGEVARAVRNAQYGNIVIKENDAIGRFNGKIHVAEIDIDSAVIELIKIMVEPENEIITIFYGADISRNEAEKVVEKLEKIFPDVELELHYGGQPHCFYIISAE